MRNQCLLFIFYFQLTIFLSVAETEFCKLSDSALSSCNKDVFKIEEWWREMSVQKPLKCETPKRWIRESPLLKLFSKQMPVVSFPCGPDETPTKYNFKGKIKDGRLDGIGKLKLGWKVLTVGDDETCLKVNRVLGHEPLEIIGTFVNGYLEGNVKIVVGDGQVVIGNYVNGLAQGFRREWNENGNLTFAGFSYRGAKIGQAWSRVGKSLVYNDIATVDRSDDLTVVVPIEEDSINRKIISGTYWPHVYTLSDFYQIEMENVALEDDSCFLKLESKLGSKETEDFFDVRLDTMIRKFSDDSKPLCEIYESQSGTVSDKLTGWFQALNEDATGLKIHQTLLQLRPETSRPESRLKIISNVSFNDEDISTDPYVPPATLNVTFFDGEHSKVIVSLAGFDEEGRLHGLVELLKSPSTNKSEEKFGFELHNVLFLRAVFNHGNVDGPFVFTTQVFFRLVCNLRCKFYL